MSKHLVKIRKAEQSHQKGFGMVLILKNNVKSKFIPEYTNKLLILKLLFTQNDLIG